LKSFIVERGLAKSSSPFFDLGGIKLWQLGNILHMIKSSVTLSAVKVEIEGLIGKSVLVKCNLGRNKYITYPARVSGVYASLFTVAPDDKNYLGKTAFSYSEVLCGRVKVKEQKDA
jgi:uncharacterized protein Veg